MKRKATSGPKARLGEQGLSGLGTWRISGSADVKRRRQQTRELRRAHRLHAGGRPDSLLGTPEVHWSEPPKIGRKSLAGLTARGAEPKHRADGGPAGRNVLDYPGVRTGGQRRGGVRPRSKRV